MDCFLIGKYQSLDENILYTAKTLYELINKKMHIDELFYEYAQYRKITLSLNVEKTLYVSLCFLYSVDKIILKNNIISKVQL